MAAPIVVNPTGSNSKSRRALLVGALGGLGAWAASAVGRASPVQATNGDIIHVGDSLTATATTTITNSTTGTPALKGVANMNVGIWGESTTWVGTRGNSDSYYGVYGTSNSGVGVYAAATTGLALEASGRTKLSTSGVATISAGSTSKTVTPGVNVIAGSFVLLTPKANIGSRALWFVTNPSANTFRIRMSSARSSGTKVAWLLLG